MKKTLEYLIRTHHQRQPEGTPLKKSINYINNLLYLGVAFPTVILIYSFLVYFLGKQFIIFDKWRGGILIVFFTLIGQHFITDYLKSSIDLEQIKIDSSKKENPAKLNAFIAICIVLFFASMAFSVYMIRKVNFG